MLSSFTHILHVTFSFCDFLRIQCPILKIISMVQPTSLLIRLPPGFGAEGSTGAKAGPGRMSAARNSDFTLKKSGTIDRIDYVCGWNVQVKHVKQDAMGVYTSGWWFGTSILFSHILIYIGNFIIPIDVHIFQRGGPGPPTRHSFDAILWSFNFWPQIWGHSPAPPSAEVVEKRSANQNPLFNEATECGSSVEMDQGNHRDLENMRRTYICVKTISI